MSRGPRARLLALVWPDGRRVAAATLLQVLVVASGMGLMATSAWLIATAALHPSIAALQVAIVGVRAFGIGRATLRYLERLVSHDVTLRLLARLRHALFRALIPLAPAALASHRQGDVLARAIEDVATLDGLYVRILGPSLAALGVAAIVVIGLRAVGQSLAPVVVLGLAAAGLAGPGLAARLAAAPGRRLVSLRGELAAGLTDAVCGCAELLAFGREAAYTEKLATLDRDARRAQTTAARAAALGSALVGLVADLTVVALIALAVPAVRAGRIEGTQLAVVALLTLACFEAVASLPLAWQSLGAVRAAGGRLLELMDTPPLVSDPPAAAPVTPGVPGRALFELRELHFSYPGETRAALAGVSLSLERGRRVAVVGPSGSGKSTLAHLLLRFWEAPPGALLTEGRDVRELPADAVRSRIAFASQQAHVFAGTLRDNLLLARPRAGDDELLAVLHGVRLGALVEQLDGGLDGWVGEEGHRLSGGERQRLALARALLRPAPLLLLDEPTAHLDLRTERKVLDFLRQAGEGRATLLVTHRLVGLVPFDEVLVLDRGRVAERGRAAELATRNGLFARLLALQHTAAAIGEAPTSEA